MTGRKGCDGERGVPLRGDAEVARRADGRAVPDSELPGLDGYVAAMRGVVSTAEQRRRVLDTMREQPAAVSLLARTTGPGAVAVRLAVAAALVLTVVLGVPALAGLGGTGAQDGGALPDGGAVVGGGHAFWLAVEANAAESDEAGASHAADVATTSEGIWPEEFTLGSEIDYRMNFEVKGEGIDSVTYRLEGPPVVAGEVWLMYRADYADLSDRGAMTQGTVVQEGVNEFVIDYGGRGGDGDYDAGDYFRMIGTRPVVGDEYDQVCRQVRQTEADGADEADPQAYGELLAHREELYRSVVANDDDAPGTATFDRRVAFWEASVRALGSCTLRLDVSFEDGTSVERTYRIAPVDDLHEVLTGLLTARREVSEALAGGRDATSLFDEQGHYVGGDERITAPLFTVEALE